MGIEFIASHRVAFNCSGEGIEKGVMIKKVKLIRNILVPTDFSANAQRAALCAAYLAQQAKARLVLLHVLSAAYVENAEALEEITQRQLDAAAHDLFLHKQISITRLLKPGEAPEEIPQMAERLRADVVLMGAKGAGEDKGSAVGSVAREVLKAAAIPVICCPTELSLPLKNELLWPLLAREDYCNQKGLVALQRFMGGLTDRRNMLEK